MKNARTLLTIVTAVFFFVSGCISKDLRAIDETTQTGVSPVTVIAHRGASAYAPENTFAAFDKAQEQGALACETDIQLSKDGQLVIFHDETLDNKTNLKGPVSAHTWAELSRVDMAPWFAKQNSTYPGAVKAATGETASRVETSGIASPTPSQRARAASLKKKKSSKRTSRGSQPTDSLTRLISLDDLFERYGMTFAYNVEIKSPDERIPALALKTVKEYALQDNVTFTSFIVDQLTRMRKLDPTIPLCYLIDDEKTPDINAEIQRASTLGFNAVSVRAPIVTADHVKRAKALKLKIISWGVTNDDDMKHAIQAGVSGMTTNWPDRLMALLQNPISRSLH